MGSFLDGTHDKPIAKPIAWIHPARKDGKYPVTFGFTARQIKKLLTLEQVTTLRSEQYYDIRIGR